MRKPPSTAAVFPADRPPLSRRLTRGPGRTICTASAANDQGRDRRAQVCPAHGSRRLRNAVRHRSGPGAPDGNPLLGQRAAGNRRRGRPDDASGQPAGPESAGELAAHQRRPDRRRPGLRRGPHPDRRRRHPGGVGDRAGEHRVPRDGPPGQPAPPRRHRRRRPDVRALRRHRQGLRGAQPRPAEQQPGRHQPAVSFITPEPSSAVLVGLGLLVCTAIARRVARH